MAELARTFIGDMTLRLHRLRTTAEDAMAQVHGEHFTAAPDPETNSIAITVKHLAGNLESRFADFPAADGESPDRDRDDEFVLNPGDTRDALMARWTAAWERMMQAVGALQDDDLTRTVPIRGEPHSVVAALNRNLVHLAYHVGQIVQLAKHYAGTDWKTLTIPRGASGQFTAAVRRTNA